MHIDGRLPFKVCHSPLQQCFVISFAQNARYVNQRKAAIQNLMQSAIRAVVDDFGRLERETPQSRTRPAQLRKWRVLNRLSSIQRL